MKTLIAIVTVVLIGSVAQAANPKVPIGRIRGFGSQTVLVETANGRMLTVYRASLSRKTAWKMGGWVSLKSNTRLPRKS